MRTVRLIAASFRLSWSPTARPVIACLLVFALILPVAALLLVDPGRSEQNLPSVRLSIVTNEFGNDMLETIQTEFEKIDLIDAVYTESREDAERRLKQNETLLYIEFPSDFFVDSLAAIKREQVNIVLNEQMPVESEFFARMADEITVTVVDLASAYFAYADLMRPYFPSPEALQRHLDLILLAVLMRLLTRNRLVTSQDAPRFDIVAFVWATILVILVLLAGLLPLFFAIRDDRLGLTARFLSTGLGDGQIQFARIVAGLPFAVLAVLPLLILTVTIFGFALPLTLLKSLLVLYIAQASIALLAARFDTESTGPVLLAFGLTFLHLLAGGVIYPAELLPPAVRSVGAFTPAAQTHALAFAVFSGKDSSMSTRLIGGTMLLALLLLITGRLRRRRLA